MWGFRKSKDQIRKKKEAKSKARKKGDIQIKIKSWQS